MNRPTVVTAPRGYARALACALCQQRKVKCDRNLPCATCTKAGVGASCVPSTPAPVRQRRRPAQDLRRRLARCEELLLQHPAVDQLPGTPPKEVQPEISGDESPRPSRPTCVVVNDESSTRLLDRRVWAALYEELRGIQGLVESEDTDAVDGEDGIPDGSETDLLLSGVDPSVRVQDLQPEPAHVFRLWQLFLDRVNPLTKIVHVPSIQPLLLEAMTDIRNVSLHHQALLFSIYTMAVASLTDNESVEMLSMPKKMALGRYTLGAKASLIKFNFLKNENMAILQALILFQASLQGRYDRYASWIISGIIVRIAHKMGYHRDGEALGLSPFETEMRRRIWWQIVVRDSTQGSVAGLTPSPLPGDWDTKEPQNLNDADLFPNSTEAPKPRDGPTEMGFCLAHNRSHKLLAEFQSDAASMRTLEAALLGQTPDGKNTAGEIQWTIARSRDLAISIDAELGRFEKKFVDPKAGNVHVAAHALLSMLTKSLIPSLTPIEEQPEYGVDILTPEDNIFKMLVTSYEHVCEVYALMLSTKFEWWMQLYFQTETLGAFIGQLYQRPVGSLSDRGWIALERLFEQRPELLDMETKENRVQAQYALKAWEAREEALVGAGRTAERPAFIDRLQEASSPFTGQSSEQSALTAPSTSVEQQELSPQMTDIEAFLEGYDSSEAISWGSWGDLSATIDGK